MKIRTAIWFTEMGGLRPIGIVIGHDEVTNEPKAYIGTASGQDEGEDAEHIARTGAKLHRQTLVDVLAMLTTIKQTGERT